MDFKKCINVHFSLSSKRLSLDTACLLTYIDSALDLSCSFKDVGVFFLRPVKAVIELFHMLS